jgi:energy-coupling factor transporter ATP-binding protein EcfA2
MLKEMSLRNFTAFPKADLRFSQGLNVIVGENGSGKSHLLKTAYTAIAVSAEGGRKPNAGDPTKTFLQKAYADKLVSVFRPESLGRLARRTRGRSRAELELKFSKPELDVAFNFSSASKSEVTIDQLPSVWQKRFPVFLPTRELLTIYPGFVSVYENHFLEFEETYRDACVLLGAPALRGPREQETAKLLAPVEEAMGGSVLLDRNGRFYLQSPGQGKMEMNLVAEGLRKLAMVARLIATGSLQDKGYLFWDEPETNLNPKLIKLVARLILTLAMRGIQLFVATHSLFLLRELEIGMQERSPNRRYPVRYFGLSPTAEGVTVEQGDHSEEIQTLLLLDEELEQSDRYMEVGG